jgi:hypothetical protein
MADNLRGVEAIYRVIEAMKAELESNPFCNKVTLGELTELDLAKMTMFPLANITMDNVTHSENSLTFQLTIVNVDIVDISKEVIQDNIYGNDNLIYIWTNQLYVINRLVARLRQSTIAIDTMELEGDPQSEFINKEFENMLAGFTTTINLTVPNDINKC